MPTVRKQSRSSPPRRRADAERSVERILEAAIDALAGDPEPSMAEIARRAGVVRATVYAHYPTREALLDAVTRRAVADVTRLIEAAEPERGDPVEALERVVGVTWRGLGRYHALIASNTRLPAAELRSRHTQVMAVLLPLIERGQRAGAFRSDVGAQWHVSMILALVHAASAELQSGRTPTEEIEAAVVATVAGAVRAR